MKYSCGASAPERSLDETALVERITGCEEKQKHSQKTTSEEVAFRLNG